MTGSQVSDDWCMFGTDDELIEQAKLDLPEKLKRVQDRAKEILEQYFNNHCLDDCIDHLNEAGFELFLDEFIVIAVRYTMDSEIKEGPVLLRSLAVEYFKDHRTALVRGMHKLLVSVRDIEIDFPRASSFLLDIVLFMVDNELLSEEFLYRVPEYLYASVSRVENQDEGGSVFDRIRTFREEQRTFKQKSVLILEGFTKDRSHDNVRLFLKHTHQPQLYHLFVKKTLIWSLESVFGVEKGEEYSSACSLLCDLHKNILSIDDLQAGFIGILGCLDDLVIDFPNLQELATDLICKCVWMDLCSAPFLHRCLALRIGGALGVSVLSQVERKLPEFTRSLGTTHFKEELRKMILEYFDSQDEHEVKLIIQELKLTDDMSSEFIRKLFNFAMERSVDDCKLALNLLSYLVRHEEITLNQVESGFWGLYERLDDISLDVPRALDLIQTIEKQAKRSKLIDGNWTYTAHTEKLKNLDSSAEPSSPKRFYSSQLVS